MSAKPFKLSLIACSAVFAVGALYQYEFDGEANGFISVPGFGSASIASPRLRGSTGIGEIHAWHEGLCGS